MSEGAKVRVEWHADRDPSPEQVEAFKAFVMSHPDARRGGAVTVAGVLWASKAIEYERPMSDAERAAERPDDSRTDNEQLSTD